jgi:copper transport protein
MAGLLLTTLALPSGSAAHAELVSSDPAANATLPDPPETLTLTFTEPIDPATSTISLLSSTQAAVEGLGAVALDAAGTTATLTVPDLEPGVYTVSYAVVSTVDGHSTSGLFAFLVDPTGTEPPPVETPTSSSSVDGATIAARWLALLPAMLALGTLIAWARTARRVLAARPGSSERLTTVPWLLVAVAAVAALASWAAYLALAARPITAAGAHGGHGGATGIPLDLAAAFGWTPFAIAARIALVGLLLTFVLAIGRHFQLDEAGRRRRPTSPTAERWLTLATLASVAIALAGMSLAGHAASIGGPAFAAIDWIHLVAAGAWLGGLPAFWVVGRRTRTIGGSAWEAARAALRDHSRLAMVAAPIVALTGLANSPLVLGPSRELAASSYGNLLLAKGLLFSVAFGIGAANHFLVRGRSRGAIAVLVAAELTVAAVAVLTAAAMVTIQPASSRRPELVSVTAGAAHLYGTAGPSSVHLAVDLPQPGPQRYHVTLADDASGVPRTDVQKAFIVFGPPADAGLPAQRIELEPDAEIPGLYGTTGANTPITGDWSLEVVVRRQGASDEAVDFVVPVVEPRPPELVPPRDAGVGVPAPLAAGWALLPDGGAAWLPALAALAVAGGFTGLAAVGRRRGRRPRRLLSAAAAAFVVVAVAAGLVAGSRAVVEAANTAPPEAVDAQNPIAADDESLRRGEGIYRANCSGCHGADGSGNGIGARIPVPRDLRSVVPERTDGELAYLVTTGVAGTPMPGFAATLTETDRWDLVNYLRATWGGD